MHLSTVALSKGLLSNNSTHFTGTTLKTNHLPMLYVQEECVGGVERINETF